MYYPYPPLTQWSSSRSITRNGRTNSVSWTYQLWTPSSAGTSANFLWSVLSKRLSASPIWDCTIQPSNIIALKVLKFWSLRHVCRVAIQATSVATPKNTTRLSDRPDRPCSPVLSTLSLPCDKSWVSMPTTRSNYCLLTWYLVEELVDYISLQHKTNLNKCLHAFAMLITFLAKGVLECAGYTGYIYIY